MSTTLFCRQVIYLNTVICSVYTSASTVYYLFMRDRFFDVMPSCVFIPRIHASLVPTMKQKHVDQYTSLCNKQQLKQSIYPVCNSIRYSQNRRNVALCRVLQRVWRQVRLYKYLFSVTFRGFIIYRTINAPSWDRQQLLMPQHPPSSLSICFN
jgi:hypothetical protein